MPFRNHETILLDHQMRQSKHLRKWADTLRQPDSYRAITIMTEYIRSHGLGSVPLCVLRSFLRRKRITVRALHAFAGQVRDILQHSQDHQLDAHNRHSTRAVFDIWTAMMKHATIVSPVLIDPLTSMLLDFLSRASSGNHDSPMESRTALTFTLNRAMRIIARPTAVDPIANNTFQDAAIIRVLHFMAAYTPTLQINREGYRAVVCLQLAQRKTEDEQKWAELKALSWPPWKEDRTAVDADITADVHGTSKAMQTLLQMREAGYKWQAWEETTAVYAGWDLDQTPTVQKLHSSAPHSDGYYKSGAAAWEARIATTRTAQEAWACYLAFENEKIRDKTKVHRAVLQKLHEEQQRRTGTRKYSGDGRRWLYSGDAREIDPPPPSTHLHTYTATPPPTTDGFYRRLLRRGEEPQRTALAFLIANAGSLKLGIEYLRKSRYCNFSLLVSLDKSANIAKVPVAMIAAFVQLLSRYAKVPISTVLTSTDPEFPRLPFASVPSDASLRGRQLNRNHTLVHAMELLAWRQPLYRPAWTPLLQALAKSTTAESMHKIFHAPPLPIVTNRDRDHVTCHGAITAHCFANKVISMMREQDLDLDAAGLLALCNVLENAVVGSWILMRDENGLPCGKSSERRPFLHEAIAWATDDRHLRNLKVQFHNILSHSPDSFGRADTNSELLHVPHEALLHAYVRAIGWTGDHAGLCEIARWMRQHAANIRERRAADRRGMTLMRRTLIALRVFLEREWVCQSGSPNEDNSHVRLAHLRTPAPREVVQEVQALVVGVEDWQGWPSDDEVEEYTQDARFSRVW